MLICMHLKLVSHHFPFIGYSSSGGVAASLRLNSIDSTFDLTAVQPCAMSHAILRRIETFA